MVNKRPTQILGAFGLSFFLSFLVNRFHNSVGLSSFSAAARFWNCRMKSLFVLVVVLLATVRQAASYYPSPTDWRNESIYQILTDRFYDGNPSNDNAEAWHGSPYDPTSSTGINGGDFKGIQDKLGYIQSLGATAIWISPIPLNSGDNSAYHGYHAQDYYTLAPHWGTVTDLSNMVEAAHALGIKVILDIVVNHTAKLLTSTGSGWPNYIPPPGGYQLSYSEPTNQEAFPFNPTNVTPPLITTLFHTNGNIGSYTYPSATQEVVLGQLDYLDDLTTETTYVRTNMMNIYTNWVGLADVDAFRVDTAIEVDFGFWQYWCPQLHQYGTTIGKSNFFMFGEADSSVEQQIGSYTGTEGGGPFKFDAMLDYALYFNCINKVFATASGGTELIQSHYNNITTYYDSNSWYRLVTFLDNHDQPRFLSNSGATTNSLTVGLQFLYTSRGIPCLYYGTEQGFEGDNNNEDNREDMFAGGWQPQVPVTGDNFNETSPLFQQVARLNNFRRLYPALRTGMHNNLWNTSSGPGLFAYSRVLSNEEVFVCFNTASSSQTLTNRPTTYSPGTVLVNLLNTNDTIAVISGAGTNETPLITVPAMTTKIYIARSLELPLNPAVTSQSPSHAATSISTSSPIVLQFSKPMDTNSVQAAFSVTPATCVCITTESLTVCSAQAAPGTPATPGTFTWDALQDTMTFTPSGGWPALTTNLVHLTTNAVDSVSGNSFYGPFDTYFVTTSNTVLSCEISGPNSVCGNSSSLTYTALANMLISSVDWLVSGNGAIIGPTNGASVVVNAGGPGTFTLVATVATSNSTSSCEQVVAIDPYLLAYWTFDEGTGSFAYDYSGNSNTGTVVLGTGYWTGGMINGALSFDGQSTQVIVTNSPSLNPANGITLAAWVNAGGFWTGNNRILEKGASDNQYALLINNSGQLEFLVAGVTNVVTSPPSVSVWHHVAGTYDGSSVLSLYIDGQLATQQLATGSIPETTDSLAIGTEPGNSSPYDFFYGILDDVRIYCGALTPLQIAQLYNTDSIGDGIANWWRLQYFGSSSSTNAASCAGCDDDGTSQNNLFKYVAGLNPTSPASLFQLTIATSQSVEENLQFLPMVGGRTYEPQFNTSLVNGVWLPLTTYTGPSTNGNQITVTDTNPVTPQEFYRVHISLP
jgi:glycosidase